MLKYLKVILLDGPIIIFSYFSWMIRFAKHPEKYPRNVRYQKLRYLVLRVLKHFNVDIVLNDFDKIPLEIIIFLAIIIECIPFILLDEITRDYNAIISLVITGGLVIYVLCAIILNTTVKRLKSKTFLKSTLTGKILKWISICAKALYHKLKIAWDTLTYSSDLKVKVIVEFIVISALAIFIFLVFHNSGMVVILEFILIAVTLYKIIKFIKNCSQIERKLKEMYEEDNSNKLYEEDFGKEFKNSVRYLNNISNGFEDAIQERLKSERMKVELITNVSHDIKTPLTSIINYVDLLKKEKIDNEQAKGMSNSILKKDYSLLRCAFDIALEKRLYNSKSALFFR